MKGRELVALIWDALAFNWLIGGTDAHAKNCSLLHGSGGRVRLAPLYDLASVLAYPGLNPRRAKLAMKIGSEYRLHMIFRRHWETLARELRLDPDRTIQRVTDLAEAVTDAAPRVRASMKASGLQHPIVGRLLDLIAKRTAECRRDLAWR